MQAAAAILTALGVPHEVRIVSAHRTPERLYEYARGAKGRGLKVIIAGAGMSSGGRIRSHEKNYLPSKNAAVLFTGYQSPGSLGRRIQDGEKNVRIDGEIVPVRASISSLSGYSGHKDRDGLIEFVSMAGQSLEKVFVVMGEPKASGFLAQRIKDFLGILALVPRQGEVATINF